jgi:hypothetical protein
MTDGGIQRTEYWNTSQPGTVRTGATGHGESLTDMESYLLPMDQARGSGLYSWGVADGLAIQATANSPGLTITPGTALDAAGRLIVLTPGGTAITDPTIDPSQVDGVPTVPVTASGVTLATANVGTDCILTLTWHEVGGQSTLGSTPALLHAPWLRLEPAAGFADTGAEVVLAEVTIDTSGNVTGLSAGRRRQVGIPAGRLELRIPTVTSVTNTLAVDHRAAAQLSADDGGGIVFALLSGATPQTALAIDGLTGEVTVPGEVTAQGTVSAAGGLRVTSAGGQAYQMSAGTDGSWHFTDATAGTDRFLVSNAGNLGVGIGSQQPQRIFHVEGSEVHSGGTAGGFSFADRQVRSLVNQPQQGERWVWYSQSGAARLWSGSDRLWVTATGEGGGLDVGRRMRVRQASDASAGIWFFQTSPAADRAFVGMADDTHVGLYGNTGAGWGLQMDTGTREVLFGGDFGRPDGASTLSLFGSQIGDVGNGVLFLRSGGSVVAFDGDDKVGINTTTPLAPLDVSGPGTGYAIIGRGGNGTGIYGTGSTGIYGSGNVGVLAEGTNNGIWVTGPTNAGVFFGSVRIFGDLFVQGTLSKGGGGFRIDHPLDPAGKYLSHSFVESPEMLNIYTGTVVTDDHGEATISLPDYFEALNRDHRFQLTPVGQLSLVTVLGGVRDNRFAIRTDQPGVTVSWQVTGVRQDPWAQAHRIVAEENKAPDEQNLFLHPEENGQPESKSLAALTTDQAQPGTRKGDGHEGPASGTAG